MTKAEIKLLQKCIFALRSHDEYTSELVEVGWINGVDPRTAKSLVDKKILVYDMPYNATRYTNSHVRFPDADEIFEIINSW